MRKSITDKLRAWPWLALAIVITVVVFVIAPHQLGVLAWSLSKLAFGAYLGYWIDRSIFHYARPGDVLSDMYALRMGEQYDASQDMHWHVDLAALRRALIIAAAILALGLGV
ncbi:MAG: putative holin [Porticoccaceae bacterium]|nr:putative holin [Porticoccaceae bacterium]